MLHRHLVRIPRQAARALQGSRLTDGYSSLSTASPLYGSI